MDITANIIALSKNINDEAAFIDLANKIEKSHVMIHSSYFYDTSSADEYYTYDCLSELLDALEIDFSKKLEKLFNAYALSKLFEKL